jgi:sporulation protein YlmC with PRC-barrel domain
VDPGIEKMRLSDLLGLEVRTESGEKLGRVHDARAELTRQSLKVTGLVVGQAGLLGAPRTRTRIRVHDSVPWSAVIRADRRGVVVRDGTEPQ